MPDKLLYVSCVVRDSHVYDLLRALEAHKVGNVEVRPVTPREERLALPAPGQHKRVGFSTVQPKVREVMVLKQKLRLRDIVRAADANPHSVFSALRALVEEGVVKRAGLGIYMRIKPDQPTAETEAAA